MAVRRFDPEQFGSSFPWRLVLRLSPLIILVLLVIYAGLSSFYVVEPNEEAVVLRFGRFAGVTGPGLHFKVPFVDEAEIVRVDEHRFRLPFARVGRPQRFTRTGEEAQALMLTGDLNAAVVEWTIQWRVRESDQHLFAIERRYVEPIIMSVAQSVMHRLIGDHSIDEMLTSKREEIGNAASDATQQVLDRYDSGIRITGLQMQRATPPERVKPAFDEYNASLQLRDKLINEANRERNKLIPQAEATRDRLIREAEGYAARRRAEAQGEIAALLAKYRAYNEAPEVTRRRLYLEALEDVLSGTGSKTIIDSELRSLVPLMQVGERDGSAGTSPRPRRNQP